MPFLQAGFNGRHHATGIRGWTRHVSGKRFAPAELIRFERGDYGWHGKNFLAWGEQCVIGTRPEFSLPLQWQHGLPQSDLSAIRRGAKPVKFVVPYPVSANRYWRTFVPRGQSRPITLVSEDAKNYKEECGWRAKAAGVRVPFDGPIELRIRLVPENKVCMDLDNCLKVTIDALKGIVYEDDSQVYKIVAERSEPDPGKRLEIEVIPFTIPLSLEAAA